MPWHKKEARDREWQRSWTEEWEKESTHQSKKELREQEREWQTWCFQQWGELVNAFPMTKRKKQQPDMTWKWDSMKEQQGSWTEAWEEKWMHQPKEEAREQEWVQQTWYCQMTEKKMQWLTWEGRKRASVSKRSQTEAWEEELMHQPEKEVREWERAGQTWHCQTTERKKQWPDVRRKQESMREQQRSWTEVQEERVDTLTWEGSKRAREIMASMTLPDDWVEETMNQHEKEVREHKRAAKKSNRSTRGRVNTLTQQGSERVRERVQKTWCCQTTGGRSKEAMNQCKKEVRECARLAKKSYRSMRGRLNTPMWEGRKRASERVANTILSMVRRTIQCTPNNGEEEAMT